MTECPGPQLATGEGNEVDPAFATDLEWHLNPAHPHAFCGGCGDKVELCHPERCCTDAQDLLGFSAGVCDLCSTRHTTGQAVAP